MKSPRHAGRPCRGHRSAFRIARQHRPPSHTPHIAIAANKKQIFHKIQKNEYYQTFDRSCKSRKSPPKSTRQIYSIFPTANQMDQRLSLREHLQAPSRCSAQALSTTKSCRDSLAYFSVPPNLIFASGFRKHPAKPRTMNRIPFGYAQRYQKQEKSLEWMHSKTTVELNWNFQNRHTTSLRIEFKLTSASIQTNLNPN